VRALTEQPEPAEGRLAFEQARTNFYAAARDGLDARIVWLDGQSLPMGGLLERGLLPLARVGLEQMGIDRDEIDIWLGVIQERVRSGRNGTAWQRAYVRRHGTDMEALTQAYLERQGSGSPVHEWEV